MRTSNITWIPLYTALLATACAAEHAHQDGTNAGASTSVVTPTPAVTPAPVVTAPPPATGPTTDLYFAKYGDATKQPVVFLHGGPGATSFVLEATAAQQIADRGYYVITYDQRGSERSPKGTTADFSFAASTKDLANLIDVLQLKSPVLLGHSFGGIIALNFLELHPGIARGVMVIDSPLNQPATSDALLTYCEGLFRAQNNTADADATHTAHQHMFPNGLVPPFDFQLADLAVVGQDMMAPQCNAIWAAHTTDDANALLNGPFSAKDAPIGLNSMVGLGYEENEHFSVQDYVPLLAKHKDHGFAMYGDEDHMIGDNQRTEIQTAIGVSHYATIVGASHMPMIDQRQTFIDTVTKQLALMP
jgi:proline iminopeptidase